MVVSEPARLLSSVFYTKRSSMTYLFKQTIQVKLDQVKENGHSDVFSSYIFLHSQNWVIPGIPGTALPDSLPNVLISAKTRSAA